jgi:uncharacterized protein
MRTGTVNLPLHGGKAPRWLFNHMKDLSREILSFIVSEYGPEEVLDRLSDPFWFQAFGCVLGFDWHSSGVTTTVCGAVKEAVKGREKDFGLFVAGGKGGTSRKTPSEIEAAGEKMGIDFSGLVYNSKIVAKVDSTALQDDYQLYHHCFLFTLSGKKWSVIQQGMNEFNRMARRYHWSSSEIEDLVCEPHKAICCDSSGNVINLVARESSKARSTITEISYQKPRLLLDDLKKIKKYQETKYNMPRRHTINLSDVEMKRLEKIFISTYETRPENFEKLISLKGMGPKTVRSLAMISELVYGEKYSIKDPVRFSFAHGGKDGIPYPVDRETYTASVDILHSAIKESRLGRTDKVKAIKRLSHFYG